MTNPHRNDAGSDAAVRRRGKAFILAFYGALRAIKLYPIENAAVVKALEDLTSVTHALLQQERDLEFRTASEFIFINSTRLRLDLDNYASFSQLLSLFRGAGIGSLRVAETVGPRDWLVFLSLIQAPGDEEPEDRFQQLTGKLTLANVVSFEFAPPALGGDGLGDRHQAKEAAKRTYAQARKINGAQASAYVEEGYFHLSSGESAQAKKDFESAIAVDTASPFGDHHMGATRMSARPEDGFVDIDCRVHGVDNLYIAGSSVFPTSGYANPTLTIIALAARLGDHLAGRTS